MSADDSLISRWSRRKAQARSGKLAAEPAVPMATPAGTAAVPPAVAPVPAIADCSAPPAAGKTPALPSPTLEDVARLGRDADFSRFVLPGVDEGVKQAAMRKLFSDPHFNVMDGLDTYIDDYGQPDPIADSVLRRMTQSKFLRLFDEEAAQPGETAGAVPLDQTPEGAAPPALPPSNAGESGGDATDPTDEDTDLRLQPDDAAGPAGAGPHCPGDRA